MRKLGIVALCRRRIRRSKASIAIILAVGFFGWGVAFTSVSYGANRKDYVAAAAKIRWQVNLDRVECISTIPHGATIFQKDFFDDTGITEVLKALWPGKIVYRDNRNCPHVIVFTIQSGVTRAVKYRGRPSVIYMAFQICARKPDTGIDDNYCSYKNIYLFQNEFTHLEAFEIGAKAFAQPQELSWAIFGLHLDNRGHLAPDAGKF